MAWTESHQELANHPKTKKLKRLLGISTAQAIGHLHLLWYWAMDYAQDGDLSACSWEDIAEAAEWEGPQDAFAEALYIAGFLDSDDEAETFRLHDWDEYAGKYFARRAQSRVRQQRFRDEHGRYQKASNALVTRESRRSNTVRGEERTEEERTTPLLVPPAGGEPKVKKKTVRATQVPEDWKPSQELYDWAIEQGFTRDEVFVETPRFIRNHRSKGNTFKDIGLAWQNWMDRSRSFSQPRASPNGRPAEQRRPAVPRFDDIRHRYERSEREIPP